MAHHGVIKKRDDVVNKTSSQRRSGDSGSN